MKAPIDKLFREKLEQHNMEAPPLAWNRIEGVLPEKTKSFLWLKIAASLLVLIAATVLLWPREENASLMVDNNKPTEKTISNKQKEKASKETERAKSTTEENEIKTDRKKDVKPNDKSIQPKPTPPIMNFSKQELLIAANENDESKNETTIKEENSVATLNSETTTERVEPATATVSNNESSTLVLAASDVSKYLKTTTVADATSEEENTSSFRKLLDKAADLKNSDSGLSELRQKKNEILALNFRNDKRERNN